MASQRPNLLLITTDQHRHDCLGCAGHPLLRTPNIDRLASAGVRFDRAYSANPICQPTRASILTGRYPHEHGVVANLIDMSAHEPTMIGLLGEAGYFTASIGHTQVFAPDQTFGFRYVDPVCHGIGANDNYRRYLKNKGLSHLDGQAKGDRLPFEVYTHALSFEDYCDSYIGRKAVEFLETVDGRPFILWVGFVGPHFPFDPPEPHDRIYDPAEVPLPVDWPTDLAGKPALHHWNREMGFDRLTDELIRRIRSHYYGNITLIDQWIGRIIDVLEKRNLANDTVVLFTSDHGELLGDHGLLWKCEHAMYEPSVRVPMVLGGAPFAEMSGVRTEFVESVDVAPTFLDLAGIEIPGPVQGRSLLGLLKGAQAPWRDAAFSEGRAIQTREGLDQQDSNLSVVMIRTDRWKYVYHRDEPSFCELYDLEADAAECHNLAGRGRCASIEAELRERILLWRFDTQRTLHGQTCDGFAQQMSRPVVTGQRPPDFTVAPP